MNFAERRVPLIPMREAKWGKGSEEELWQAKIFGPVKYYANEERILLVRPIKTTTQMF